MLHEWIVVDRVCCVCPTLPRTSAEAPPLRSTEECNVTWLCAGWRGTDFRGVTSSACLRPFVCCTAGRAHERSGPSPATPASRCCPDFAHCCPDFAHCCPDFARCCPDFARRCAICPPFHRLSGTPCGWATPSAPRAARAGAPSTRASPSPCAASATTAGSRGRSASPRTPRTASATPPEASGTSGFSASPCARAPPFKAVQTRGLRTRPALSANERCGPLHFWGPPAETTPDGLTLGAVQQRCRVLRVTLAVL